MRNNTSYNEIKIDSGKINSSKFSFNHDVNTSASFGMCQPVVAKLIVPNSKTSMSIDPIVRMSAMVAPTVGRISYQTWSSFIGFSDLLRSSSAFLTKKSYASTTGVRKQTQLPSMAWRVLSAFILTGCKISVYKRTQYQSGAQIKKFEKLTSNEMSSLVSYYRSAQYIADPLNSSAYPDYVNSGLSMLVLANYSIGRLFPMANDATGNGDDWQPDYIPSSGNSFLEGVTIDSADYVFEREWSNQRLAFAVRLSSFGQQFRKILIGLGYQINFQSDKQVSLMPLFAYYKAWFDSFGLTLYQNYESTNAAMILNAYDNGDASLISSSSDTFILFINDLVNTWVTDPQDFISAHTRTDAVSSAESGFINNVICVDPNTGSSVTSQDSSQEATSVVVASKHAYINNVKHTEVDAELLKRLYKFTNRSTIAGQRIAELLRAGGYGKYVDEQKSSFIGHTKTELEIGTVTATADGTNSVTNNDSVVGEYVGIGFGHNKEASEVKHVFENDEFGYWITLGAIVPENGYCQGMDLTLFDTYPEQMYQSDFDGLGMELSPRAVLKGSQDWVTDESTGDYFASSFGLVPRFSRYKVSNNKCNGQFSLRSARNGFLPFVFDKFIDADDGFVTKYDSNNVDCFVKQESTSGDLPLAGNTYRFNSRYPWLSNLNRIFAHFDHNAVMFAPSGDSSSMSALESAYHYLYLIDDNFLIFNQIQMTCYAPMLPISESYGTLDDNGHSDTTMSKS